jgi:hypothetical protein
MAKGKSLTTLQKDVINDLFSGKKGEQKVLRDHKVSETLFSRWLKDSDFMSEMGRRILWCQVQSELILSRSKSNAAKKLVKLSKFDSKETGSKETARKACLDILKMSGAVDKSVVDANKEKSGEEMAPELAGRVLAAMANAKRGGDAR